MLPIDINIAVYSPRTLAERWGCSEAHVRAMVRNGKLKSFSLGGKLIRITAEEVRKWETNQSLSGTEENLPCHSPTKALDSAVRSARLIGQLRGPDLTNLSGKKTLQTEAAQ